MNNKQGLFVKNLVIRVSKVEQVIQKSNVFAYSLEKLELLKEIIGTQISKLYSFIKLPRHFSQ